MAITGNLPILVQEEMHAEYFVFRLVVLTHLKNISQNGNLPQIGVKIKIFETTTSFSILGQPCSLNIPNESTQKGPAQADHFKTLSNPYIYMYELSNVAQVISMIQRNLGSWLVNLPPPNVPLQENKGSIRPY